MVYVYGFAGLRDYDGRLCFGPRIPETLNSIRFQLMIRDQVLQVDANQKSTRYWLREGTGLSVWHEGEELKLDPSRPSIKRNVDLP
jgi:alpha,alpha-trehalose phosphorylase